MNIRVEKASVLKQKPTDESGLGFGKIFTDHMFLMNYDEGQGWHDARIVPYAPLSLEPSAMCLHYAQEVFEGLKAYRTANGEIKLFRPEKNMARLNVSNDRLCIPLIDEEFAVEAIKTLVNLEQDWVPHAENTSLYIRPFIFGTDPVIGVHPAKHLLFVIILSPSGAYFKAGLDPVDIYVENNYVRAVKGGTGNSKAGGNYATSLRAQDDAEKLGFSQVLWLDGVERKYIEEVGAMNVFFVLGNEVVTPELGGSILPGITRMSVIELLKSKGYKVSERKVSITEIAESYRIGGLVEAFGTGTAAVIAPIGRLKWGDTVMEINNRKIGKLSQELYDTLTGIQWGKIEDTFGWMQNI